LLCSRDGGQTWRALTVSDGLPSNVVQALASDGEHIWAGTDGGIWVNIEGPKAAGGSGARTVCAACACATWPSTAKMSGRPPTAASASCGPA